MPPHRDRRGSEALARPRSPDGAAPPRQHHPTPSPSPRGPVTGNALLAGPRPACPAALPPTDHYPSPHPGAQKSHIARADRSSPTTPAMPRHTSPTKVDPTSPTKVRSSRVRLESSFVREGGKKRNLIKLTTNCPAGPLDIVLLSLSLPLQACPTSTGTSAPRVPCSPKNGEWEVGARAARGAAER